MLIESDKSMSRYLSVTIDLLPLRLALKKLQAVKNRGMVH